jgi:SAM-dependent methyltransferase
VSTHRDWDDLAGDLGVRAVADGEPTRWYDELWSAAGRGEVALPWDHTDAHPVLASFSRAPAGEASRAVVVGCGLGADSEHLARLGWETTAFDISPAAVAAVRERYPDSPVDYRVGDLLDLDPELALWFERVVEIYTVQALHPSLREAAVTGLHGLIGPGGSALVVQMVRGDDEPRTAEPPWTLTRAEVEALAGDGVRLDSLDEVRVQGPAHPLWRAVLTRS